MEVKIPNTVPVPGFVVAATIEYYETDPAALILLTIIAIKRRARLDADPTQSQIKGNPQWLFGLAVIRLSPKPLTQNDQETGHPEYTSKQFLAVKAQSLVP
jgi:hypothetical protein